MSDPVSSLLGLSSAPLALRVIGDAWVLRILRSSFRGARRFSEHLRALEISRAVLTDRLDRMCKDGLIEKVQQPGTHPEYRLTEMALDLWSPLIAMWLWERNWGTGVDPAAPVHDRPRRHLLHKKCGHVIEPRYVCAACKLDVSPFDTYATLVGTEAEPATSAQDIERKRYRKSSSEDRVRLPTLLKVYGDRWNTTLMAAAFLGNKTFSEFSSHTGIWPSALSDRLEELQSVGMLRAINYAGSRQEYRLTRAAIATFPVTLELIRWGDRWLSKDEPPLQIMHRPCSHRLKALWFCTYCQEELQRTSVSFKSAQSTESPGKTARN